MSIDCRGAADCTQIADLQVQLIQDYLSLVIFFVVVGMVAYHVYRHRSVGAES